MKLKVTLRAAAGLALAFIMVVALAPLGVEHKLMPLPSPDLRTSLIAKEESFHAPLSRPKSTRAGRFYTRILVSILDVYPTLEYHNVFLGAIGPEVILLSKGESTHPSRSISKSVKVLHTLS